MYTIMPNILRFVSIISCFVLHIHAVHREISYTVNPNCNIPECLPKENNSSVINVIHIEAVGGNDTIHYLCSMYKLPTLIITKTSHQAKLQIDWEGLLNFQEDSISFSEDPFQSVSFIINEIWEFFDDSDAADLDKGSNIMPVEMTNVEWNDFNDTVYFANSFFSSSPQSHNLGNVSNSSVFFDNGYIKVQFSVSGYDEQSDDAPRLWFNGASAQLKLILSKLHTVDKKSRFAAEIISVSSFPSNTGEIKWSEFSITSFNDEYSPGVFKVNQLYSESSGDDHYKNFVVWKPVSYIGERPTVANSTDAANSSYVQNSIDLRNTIAASYFSINKNWSTVTWNMTFGSSGDGFYRKTKYTAWSVMVGIGEPIMESMSILALIVTSVGLGMPLLMICLGGSFMGYKKCLKKDDDDLLLEG